MVKKKQWKFKENKNERCRACQRPWQGAFVREWHPFTPAGERPKRVATAEYRC